MNSLCIQNELKQKACLRRKLYTKDSVTALNVRTGSLPKNVIPPPPKKNKIIEHIWYHGVIYLVYNSYHAQLHLYHVLYYCTGVPVI